MKFAEPKFVPTLPSALPQDPRGDGAGWTFKTLEHDEHTFPTAIKAKDAEGRSCIYIPLKVGGKIGRWK